ncbi:Hypothetical protein LUCI_1194 [Lucifera butyrica]|uniref:PRC-barrel domain-containing protein n=1 Tax=Lucifera butyrica TaxID=1351585 RepID=A0A498R740_9FIRM|nr:PRC-barrel domain-containing protein [Lucifera butyrica]VBB05983.1 Hypothetical protein LUCI_1194 [Lucifera butyrica]
MKKSESILGLSVVSISEGSELGTVKDLVINPGEGTVAALLIDDGKWYLGAKLLPYTAIISIGEYAVTVEAGNSLLDIHDVPELEQLLAEEVKIIGTKVLTKTGQITGKVTEFIIDDAGKISACEIEEISGNIVQIPSQRIVTFGKSVLVITAPADEPAQDHNKPASAIVTKPAEVKAVPAETATTPDSAPVEPSQPEQPTDDSAKKFDERHRKFLVGKKASRRIETDHGVVIVEQGGEITEEVLQKAKLAGKLVELSMSTQ